MSSGFDHKLKTLERFSQYHCHQKSSTCHPCLIWAKLFVKDWRPITLLWYLSTGQLRIVLKHLWGIMVRWSIFVIPNWLIATLYIFVPSWKSIRQCHYLFKEIEELLDQLVYYNFRLKLWFPNFRAAWDRIFLKDHSKWFSWHPSKIKVVMDLQWGLCMKLR